MISLRKINSILIIVLVALLAYHALVNTLLFFGILSYSSIFKISGRRVFYPLILHIIISLYLYIKERLKKSRSYPKLTRETVQQLVSGICIIIFAAAHILNYSGEYVINPLQIINHIIVDNLLFISIAIHLQVSIPRLLVSFGFLEGKDDYKNVKNKITILLLIVLIMIFTAQATFYGGVI